jgi:deazaflavin-dependent oxidoreductase (nitroreductase family)
MGSRRFTRIGNRIGVATHRVAKGRLDGRPGSVLMLTCEGRRTGVPRSVMVRYLEHDGGYLVWGTGSGSRTEPDWFRNLRQAATAEVELGSRRRLVVPEVLDDESRDAVWRQVVVPAVPGVVRYERRSGRVIPVAVLRPTGARSG